MITLELENWESWIFYAISTSSNWHSNMVSLGKFVQRHLAVLPQAYYFNEESVTHRAYFKLNSIMIVYITFILYSKKIFLKNSNDWANPNKFTSLCHSFYIKQLSLWAAINRVNYKNSGRACQRCECDIYIAVEIFKLGKKQAVAKT